MKTLDQWTDRLEELIEEEAWHKPPTGERPEMRAVRRLAEELRDEVLADALRPFIHDVVQSLIESGDRPH